MKYIVVELNGEEQIFIFPKSVDHDRMMEAIGAIRMGSERNWNRQYRDSDAISAGFVVNGCCQGHSETLQLKSRDEVDTALLRKAM